MNLRDESVKLNSCVIKKYVLVKQYYFLECDAV
jgi:hypothetical protein